MGPEHSWIYGLQIKTNWQISAEKFSPRDYFSLETNFCLIFMEARAQILTFDEYVVWIILMTWKIKKHAHRRICIRLTMSIHQNTCIHLWIKFHKILIGRSKYKKFIQHWQTSKFLQKKTHTHTHVYMDIPVYVL